jgi:mono/diheme cytochrome c family protein
MLVGVATAFTTASSSQELDVSKAEYFSSCAACHGADAKGNGPLSADLKIAPADLTVLAKKNQGVFPLSVVYEIIDGRKAISAHGTRDMPIWGYRYTPSRNVSPKELHDPKLTGYADLSYDPEAVVRGRILAVVDYLSRIQQK